ncbi:MAG: ABC transporter permease [Cyanobacteria bacterium SZAS TMP-1]|nr:ABC transporter permease [Cyanobacteria bacterium SZAS TMP-1]
MSLTTIARHVPGADVIRWLSPLGRASKYFILLLMALPGARFSWDEMRPILRWMGPKSFHLVALAAVVVAIALTMQCVLELERYQAQDLAGAVISLGLLREMGPLTVSLAWCARVAALIADQAHNYTMEDPTASDAQFAGDFVLPRYISALAMSVPLGGYGLVIGFITGALFTPLMTLSTTQQFVDSAKTAIQDKDLVVYFLKLILVNPTIGVFAGCVAGRWAAICEQRGTPSGGALTVMSPAANAVTALFVCGFAANLIVSLVAYFQ